MFHAPGIDGRYLPSLRLFPFGSVFHASGFEQFSTNGFSSSNNNMSSKVMNNVSTYTQTFDGRVMKKSERTIIHPGGRRETVVEVTEDAIDPSKRSANNLFTPLGFKDSAHSKTLSPRSLVKDYSKNTSTEICFDDDIDDRNVL